MKPFVQKALLLYSATLSTVFAVAMIMGAKSQRNAEFNVIRAQRLNIVEPDGTLRMVISNHDQMPGVILKGKEFPKVDRPEAGMLFYNDEGTENGGLIFGGHRNEQGEIVDSGASLSFDPYGESQQLIQLAGVEDKDNRIVGLAVNEPKNHSRNRRIWVGRGDDDSAIVSLMDANGKKRIVMQVAADGTPSLDFLDAKGQVVRHFISNN
ncbi:hypothetical protein [Alloacidobacterium sp.]|uniref:hypothetical protein n=1 Tax=Alloacidobacterium sp. TaxID=2951999 RepID=UPI002D62ECBC|nr:hypothetical protein [Alloacidobacterium sp.]HYK38355.1 hypothetical protein [Alloacidobacterium sp.]